ncbi:hypothetical protein [Vreelandella subglaciescola]|jgi:hypothetical protein|uniref:Uncharacterized protein n=1 Tax=Vreelandella subglaciescola TaxID=29571 RepID=A0A1M7EHL0_9GAMM|nr:hypothetical protein [Halomonas subglaciescola]SHL91264.1 hypothetical protein SAMN05878437_0228 [Halomonas subglaciescola]
MEDENSPALRASVNFRGSKNATQPVLEHIKPGKKRAPLLRYIRINLPRTTRLLLVAMVAVIGAASAAVALSNQEPFPFATPVLWSVFGAAAVFVAVGLMTSARIWKWGLMIALSSLLIYIGGLVGDAPYIWNGASVVSAAIWNLTLFASLSYLVLFAALRYGMIVAAPDNQYFMD